MQITIDSVDAQYDRYCVTKRINQQERMLGLTLIKMYYLSQEGRMGVSESQFDAVPGLAKMDWVSAVRLAESRGLISPCHSNQGKQWIFNDNGDLYIAAILSETQKY